MLVPVERTVPLEPSPQRMVIGGGDRDDAAPVFNMALPLRIASGSQDSTIAAKTDCVVAACGDGGDIGPA